MSAAGRWTRGTTGIGSPESRWTRGAPSQRVGGGKKFFARPSLTDRPSLYAEPRNEMIFFESRKWPGEDPLRQS